MLKRFLSFLFLACLFFAATNIWAMEVSLLDANFERLKGKSLPYEVPFYAEEGMGTLILSNGANDGNYRISSATITLNGEVIVTPDDMNQDVSGLTREVYLLLENVLVVELTSAPESFIDISIRQEVFTDAEKTIDSEGGVLEVTDQSSPLFGTKLEIPSGALIEPTTITVTALEAPPETPNGVALTGQAIDLEPEGLTFDQPITIILNYSDSNDDGIVDGTVIDEEFVVAGYFNESKQLWETLEIVERDFLNNTISIKTNHFSIYSPFVRVDNSISQTTQQIVPGTIMVDGDPSDWETLGLLPTKVDSPDPEGDSLCGPGSDIKHVYTAIDDDYAYIMIDMHDGALKSDMTIRIDADIRPGHDLLWSTYGDLGMHFHGTDVPYANLTSAWTTDFDLFGYYPDYKPEGTELAATVRGTVLEARVPLALIKTRMEAALGNTIDVNYFNVTRVRTHIEYDQNECDVDELHPKIDWFRFQKRLYADKPDHTRFIFSQISRLGTYLSDINHIDQIVVTRPDNTTLTLVQSDLTHIPEVTAFNSYDQYTEQYRYGAFQEEHYFLKKYFDGELLQLGTYRMELTDTSGSVYEASYTVKRTEDIPTVDSETVQCFINAESQLECSWNYPEFTNVNEQDLNALPHLIASNSGEDLRLVYVGTPYLEDIGKLKNDFIIPKPLFDQLIEGADKLIISVRTRTRNDDVRSYSATKDISIEAGL